MLKKINGIASKFTIAINNSFEIKVSVSIFHRKGNIKIIFIEAM